MIQDQQLARAVSGIRQRSERQGEIAKVLGAFVDVGILPQLLNDNNQIVYGRRGTGKTHVLRVLGSRLAEQPRTTVAYIDARTLGSTSQFSDPTIPLPARCLALFRDVLGEFYAPLLEHVVNEPPKDPDKALKLLDDLANIGLEKTERVERETLTDASTKKRADGASASLGTGPTALAAEVHTGREAQETKQATYRVQYDDKVVFPALHRVLHELLMAAETRLYVLFDEWSSLPPDVQPYLAEFLKRGVLPIRDVTLKIASLEYRSRFSLRVSDNYQLGFELGADVTANQDLDDYYVFDRNPYAIASAYADILYRHLSIELPPNYLKDKFRVTNGDTLVASLFTETATFRELSRAAEGVVRDLINIFTIAFFHAQRRSRDTIDRKAVIEAARSWFEQDKAKFLDDPLHGVLQRIVDEVIGRRRARSFLLPRDLERHPVIQRLFDARVLHQMQRGYADKDNPGVRYNIYTLDYGTYVDLLGTSKQPDMDLLEPNTPQPDLIVPFDDKRAIRRIVLPEPVLKV